MQTWHIGFAFVLFDLIGWVNRQNLIDMIAKDRSIPHLMSPTPTRWTSRRKIVSSSSPVYCPSSSCSASCHVASPIASDMRRNDLHHRPRRHRSRHVSDDLASKIDDRIGSIHLRRVTIEIIRIRICLHSGSTEYT